MGPARFPDFRKNQLELLVLVVVALIQAQSVKHSKLAERLAGVAQFDSALRRIERPKLQAPRALLPFVTPAT